MATKCWGYNFISIFIKYQNPIKFVVFSFTKACGEMKTCINLNVLQMSWKGQRHSIYLKMIK